MNNQTFIEILRNSGFFRISGIILLLLFIFFFATKGRKSTILKIFHWLSLIILLLLGTILFLLSSSING